MAILGNLIARSLRLRKKLTPHTASARTYQLHTLRQLLERAQYTRFGRHYGFGEMLSNELDLLEAFRKSVPVVTYNEMFANWWKHLLEGEENITWPGKVKYFALSSGTSEAASKHIPVTSDMIRSVKRMGFKQLYSMTNFRIPAAAFGRGIMMIGGTTSLNEQNGYFEGDMSGISAKNMPRWVSNLLYKPGQKISKTPQWDARIEQIVEHAPDWDISTLCGVPAWVQIVLERILERHNAKNIHDIWPNLSVYIHGGVSFEPYRENFKKLLGKPITFIETYMASEGSFGFQAQPDREGIRLVLNNGIFFEFAPFNSENFDDDGNPKPGIQTRLIDEVEKGVDYAVVISTCSGAWRYVIGDVVRFTNTSDGEIIIAGRTKQFLSLVGEHLSVDNMNKGIDAAQRELGITIREFTVAGFPYEGLFAHRWYIGCEDECATATEICDVIDQTLRRINDDYAVERDSALKRIFVNLLPNQVFYDYLRSKGKEGGMNKFPRVLKGKQLTDWENYLKERGLYEAAG